MSNPFHPGDLVYSPSAQQAYVVLGHAPFNEDKLYLKNLCNLDAPNTHAYWDTLTEFPKDWPDRNFYLNLASKISID